MRHWIYVKNEKDAASIFIQLGVDVLKLTPKPSVIAKELKAAWEQLVDEKVTSKVGALGKDYVGRYKKGMRVTVAGGQVRASLVGFEANRIERGWAPPDSQEMIDGIGEYDGQLHDMRPFILQGQYKKVLKMNIPKSSQEIIADVKQDVTHSLMRRAHTESQKHSAKIKGGLAARLFAKGSPSTPEVPGLEGLKEGETLSSEYTRKLPKLRRKDLRTVKYIYAGITRTRRMDGKRGWIFSTYRTITDSEKQHKKKLWYTAGNRPVNLMEKLPALIRDIAFGGEK